MARGSGLPSAELGVHIPVTCGTAMVKKEFVSPAPFVSNGRCGIATTVKTEWDGNGKGSF